LSALSAHARHLAEAGRLANEIRLSVEQVSYAHSANPAQAPLFTLEATSFQARPGEIVAILGPNASGKSTLLKLISGALAPLSGRVLLNGFVTHSLTPRTRAQRIAVVQQESALLFPARAWEFVLQGRHAHGRSLRFESEDDILIAKNALAQVGAVELSDRWMDQISSGEKLLSQKKGGAIGLVTTARPVNSSTNFDLNKAFYNALFLKSNGHYRDLGAIFRDTKNNSVSGVANRNFSLMGDPSMRLAFPENQIQINSVKTAFNSDTLKALSTVVIRGEIQLSGIKRSDFQGEVDAMLFDRPASFTTLGDENPPFTYTRWSNVIFRGKASVIGGDFEIGLVVPKDLEADPGLGKLTLYANNGVENASGNRTVTLGGVETVFPPDTTPPEIHLFIGDTTFINGGVASPNTTLVAQFTDSVGIAITGYTDSNSLLAVLDDSITFVLNDYYSALRDDYSHGTVLFPLKQLRKGRHHIIVKASDTYSNRSSARIDFVVTEGSILISEFYSYPNPFSSLTESTILGFTHNRPGEDLDADLIIFDLAGHLVDSRHYSITESYSHVTLAIWDGAGVNGNKLTSGIYLGKLSVRSLLDGSKNEQITKLIIVN